MEAQKIILEPILTEKSYAGIPNKVYTFKVATDANKIEIKKAVEEKEGASFVTILPSLIYQSFIRYQ